MSEWLFHHVTPVGGGATGSCSAPSLFRWSRRRSSFLGQLLLFQRRSFLFVLVVVASDVGCYNGMGVLFLCHRFVCVSKPNLSPRRFGGFVLKFILCSMGFWKIRFRSGSSQFRSGFGILKSLLALSRWLGSVQRCWGRCRVLAPSRWWVDVVCWSYHLCVSVVWHAQRCIAPPRL